MDATTPSPKKRGEQSCLPLGKSCDQPDAGADQTPDRASTSGEALCEGGDQHLGATCGEASDSGAQEKRFSDDGVAYTFGEFTEFFGEHGGKSRWERGSPEISLEAGQRVRVNGGFNSDGKSKKALGWMVGTVRRLDDGGDAMVSFDMCDGHRYLVKKQNLHKLQQLALEPRDRVVVKVEFNSDGKNGKDMVPLEAGSQGAVERIDDEGDALIRFDDVAKMQWVKSSKFDKLQKVGLGAGERIVVQEDFKSDGKDKVQLRKGVKGEVKKIDCDHDALVYVDALKQSLWVSRRNFDKVQKVGHYVWTQLGIDQLKSNGQLENYGHVEVNAQLSLLVQEKLVSDGSLAAALSCSRIRYIEDLEQVQIRRSLNLFDDASASVHTFRSLYSIVGDGGRVYQVKRRSDGQVAVMKKRANTKADNVNFAAVREVGLLAGVCHPNIQRVIDVFFEENATFIVREAGGTDLFTYMRSKNALDGVGLEEHVIRSLTRQLFEGLDFCHARSIVCRDLRPANVFIEDCLPFYTDGSGSLLRALDQAEPNPTLRISGFGISRNFVLPLPKYTPQVRVLGNMVAYLSPEQLLGIQCYAPAVDIWAAGCTVAEMITGCVIFESETPSSSQITTLLAIFKMLGTPTPETWPGVQDAPHFTAIFPRWTRTEWHNVLNIEEKVGRRGCTLLDELLQCNPRQRCSARFALGHCWLRGPFQSVTNSTWPVTDDGSHSPRTRAIKRVNVLSVVSKTSLLPIDALKRVSSYLNPYPDTRMMPEYADDIIAHWRSEERVIPEYISEQPDINSKMRAILMDWIVEVCFKYKLNDETPFRAASLIDSFLAQRRIHRKRLQLVGQVAMLIAAKFEAQHPPNINDMHHICDGAYSESEIAHLEQVMLDMLRDYIRTPTVMNFLCTFMQVNRSNWSQQNCAMYSAKLAIVHAPMLCCTYKPSCLAAAAVMASNIFVGQMPRWSEAMQARTGYSEIELQKCVRDLFTLCKDSLDHALQAVQKEFAVRMGNEGFKEFAGVFCAEGFLERMGPGNR